MKLGKDFVFIARLFIKIMSFLLEMFNQENEDGNGEKVTG